MRTHKPAPRPSATIQIRHDDAAIVDEAEDDALDDAAPHDSIARPLAPRTHHRALSPPAPRRAARYRSAGESLARLLYFASGAALAAVVAIYGAPIWRQARRAPEPAIAAPSRTAAAVAVAAGGRIELAADRRTVLRLAGDAPRWTAPQPTALDAIELAGPVVLGRTPDAIAAIDLETGRTRFTWSLPTDERWGVQRPSALAGCLVALTTRPGKQVARCLELTTGAVRWTAAPAGAHDCTRPVEAVPGAFLLTCSGWTAVLDERTGAVAIEAGGLGLAQDDPPYLLRARTRPTLAPWSVTKRRFTQTGEIALAGGPPSTSSAVLHKDRLVLRAVESSDELATIFPVTGTRTGPPIPVAAPVYRLADATPLVSRCGGATSPRYQLLELAPRIGASFDPAIAGDRALALLDVQTGSLAWTSRKIAGLHATSTSAPPICRAGHYAIPIELPGRTTPPTSILWVIDAETGRTAAALAPTDPDASLAGLAADQIDDDHLVGLGKTGPFELRWQSPGSGLRDARRELADVLGPLP